MQRARNYIRSSDAKWRSVIFSEELKFDIEGTDEISYYWYNICKEKHIRVSRQMGGDDVMIWASFLFHDKSNIALLDKTQNDEFYCTTMNQGIHHLVGVLLRYNKKDSFKQDNEAIHTARTTRTGFQFNLIFPLNCPACSACLNPIENVLGVMVRDVIRMESNTKAWGNWSKLWRLLGVMFLIVWVKN